MATGTANLGIQQWEDAMLAVDAHGSFSTRIDNLTTFIESVCGYSATMTASCSSYKDAVHPLSSAPHDTAYQAGYNEVNFGHVEPHWRRSNETAIGNLSHALVARHEFFGITESEDSQFHRAA